MTKQDPVDQTGERPSMASLLVDESYQPVLVKLQPDDSKVSIILSSDVRVMDNRAAILHKNRLYLYKGNDQIKGQWYRLYAESPVVEI